MNRKNGTSRANRRTDRGDVLVTYREFAPAAELRGFVRAFFSMSPGATTRQRVPFREVRFGWEDSFCSPLFADGHASVVFELGATCRAGRGWSTRGRISAQAIGPMTAVGRDPGDSRHEMIGAYLEPGATEALLDALASTLTDRVVDLEDLWGRAASDLANDLAPGNDAKRVTGLERALLQRARRRRSASGSVDIAGIARRLRSHPAQTGIPELARHAGVSRQHLTRVFRSAIGMSPKRYGRIARFQSSLARAGDSRSMNWANAVADFGYTDQSHMIAEFREMRGLTPASLRSGGWFHPFILDARERPCGVEIE